MKIYDIHLFSISVFRHYVKKQKEMDLHCNSSLFGKITISNITKTYSTESFGTIRKAYFEFDKQIPQGVWFSRSVYVILFHIGLSQLKYNKTDIWTYKILPSRSKSHQQQDIVLRSCQLLLFHTKSIEGTSRITCCLVAGSFRHWRLLC